MHCTLHVQTYTSSSAATREIGSHPSQSTGVLSIHPSIRLFRSWLVWRNFLTVHSSRCCRRRGHHHRCSLHCLGLWANVWSFAVVCCWCRAFVAAFWCLAKPSRDPRPSASTDWSPPSPQSSGEPKSGGAEVYPNKLNDNRLSAAPSGLDRAINYLNSIYVRNFYRLSVGKIFRYCVRTHFANWSLDRKKGRILIMYAVSILLPLDQTS